MPLVRVRIGAVHILVVLQDATPGRIIDAHFESAGNLAPPFLIDVLIDLGLQPMQLAFWNLLEGLASHNLGRGHHIAKNNN